MKVIKKQKVSKMCLICGIDNHAGLKADFYEMENNQLVGLFSGQSVHQSYPNRMHGGMISAILDEAIGRTIWIHEPTIWGVTIDLHITFRKPVPLTEPLMVLSELTLSDHRIFKGVGAITLLDGTLLAEGEATYYKQKIDQISSEGNIDDANIFVPDNLEDIKIEHIKLKKKQ